MFCTQCGNRSAGGAFCSGCGTRLETTGAVAIAPAEPAVSNPAVPLSTPIVAVPAPAPQVAKSFVPVVILNILWAGSGYLYLGQFALGLTLALLNLLFFATAIGPLVICTLSCVGGYKNLQKLKQGKTLARWELM
jgi:hypothetical protein